MIAQNSARLFDAADEGESVYYTYFHVENFKGIRRLDLKLDGAVPGAARIHTLVGLNESGKTTILEAIDRFTGGDEEVDPSGIAGRLLPNENDLVPVAQRSNFNGDISISAGVRLSVEDVNALRNHIQKDTGFILTHFPDEIEVKDRYTFVNSLFAQRTTLWPSSLGSGRGPSQRKDRALTSTEYRAVWQKVTAFLKTRLPAVWYFPDFLFDFPSRVFLRPQPNESVRDRFYRTLLQDILDVLDQNMTVDQHLLTRYLSAEPAERRALSNLVLEMSRRLTADVFGAWNRILNRDVNMRVSLSVEADAHPISGTNEPYIEFKIEDNDGFFQIHERSLGFRWFFVFLLLTTFRGMRAGTDGEILFLFDEPASNLHPSAQAQLLKSLEKLAENCRVVYSTHSPHLINPDWLETTLVVRNQGADAQDDVVTTARQTDIVAEPYRSFVSHYPDQSQYFQPILDVLDYVPSRLELVEKLVLLEGKNDYYTLRYVDLSLGEADFRYYPGGGAGTLDTVISLYIAWGREFLVLLDSDSEGDKQRARYNDRFGEIVTGRIFTVSDLVPSMAGKSLDSLFTEATRTDIAAALGQAPAPSKKVFHRYLQSAVAAGQSLPIGAEAEEKLRALQSALSERFLSVSSASKA